MIDTIPHPPWCPLQLCLASQTLTPPPPPHVVSLSEPLQEHVRRPTYTCFDEEIILISIIYPDRVRVFFIYSD